MPANITQITGATEIDFYLGNYLYADVIASMENLKFKLATDINRLIFKNAAGTNYKLMHDASGATNIPNTRVLYANADGAASSNAGFVFNGTKLSIPLDLGRAGVVDDYIRLQNDKTTIHCGGNDAMVFEDDKVYTALTMGIGTATPNAANMLEVNGIVRVGDTGASVAGVLMELKKDQNAVTQFRITNNTAGNAAKSNIHLITNSCDGILEAVDDGVVGEVSDKFCLRALSAPTALLLSSEAGAGEIQFYTGGISAANRRMTITNIGGVGIGTATVPHGGVGYAKLAIEGANASAVGPHVQFTTDSDNYPLMHILNWEHDSIAILFDAYHDGNWRSSDIGSNFMIGKGSLGGGNDLLSINYDSGIAQGNLIAWNNGIVLNTSGQIGLSMIPTELVSINTPTETFHIIDVENLAVGVHVRRLKIKYGSTVGYMEIYTAPA